MILLIKGVMEIAEPQEPQTSGLMPLGVQRLRELRLENNELRAKIEALEKELASERLSHKADVANVPKQANGLATNGIPPPRKEEAEPSGPGGGTDPPPRDGRRTTPDHGQERRRSRLKTVMGNALFFLALALTLVMALFIRATRGGAPTTIAGYSGMLVLTESMQDAIPKGSFVLVKHVEPEELQIGDDVTFMVNPTTSVTHRIVDIRPQADGIPIVQTKGVNNSNPDAPIAVDNIVGKVVYHSLFLGLLANGIGENWPLLVFLLGVWTVLGRVLVGVFREENGPRGRKKTHDSPEHGILG